jgi:hypothetical protein
VLIRLDDRSGELADFVNVREGQLFGGVGLRRFEQAKVGIEGLLHAVQVFGKVLLCVRRDHASRHLGPEGPVLGHDLPDGNMAHGDLMFGAQSLGNATEGKPLVRLCCDGVSDFCGYLHGVIL